MPIHCMLDLETLGTESGCVVAQIGAVAFDPMAGKVPSREDDPNAGLCWRPTFEVNVDVEDCEVYGLKISASTVLFWFDQTIETRGAVFNKKDRKPLAEALMLFEAWYVNNKCKAIWSHGKEFDVKIIEAAMRVVGMRRPPWEFRDVLDTRTAFWMGNVGMPRSPRPHNALEDALHQARWVCNAVQRTNEGTRHAPDEGIRLPEHGYQPGDENTMLPGGGC